MIKTRVEIPNVWEKTNDGRYKFETKYSPDMGQIDIDSIPDCVNLVSSFNESLILYSKEEPKIPNGLFLVFSK